MLSGQQAAGAPFEAGPFYGYIGQNDSRVASPVNGQVQPSQYSGLFGLAPQIGSIGDTSVRALASAYGSLTQDPQTGSPSTTLSPSIGVGVGPLSLSAGLNRQSTPDGVSLSPEFNAALAAQLLGGQGRINAGISPRASQSLGASFAKQIDPNSEFAAMLDHFRPQDGTSPETRVGFQYRRKF